MPNTDNETHIDHPMAGPMAVLRATFYSLGVSGANG